MHDIIMHIFRTSGHNKNILHRYRRILLSDRCIEYTYNVHIYIYRLWPLTTVLLILGVGVGVSVGVGVGV